MILGLFNQGVHIITIIFILRRKWTNSMKKNYRANYQIVDTIFAQPQDSRSRLSNLLRKHIYVRTEEARLARGETWVFCEIVNLIWSIQSIHQPAICFVYLCLEMKFIRFLHFDPQWTRHRKNCFYRTQSFWTEPNNFVPLLLIHSTTVPLDKTKDSSSLY